MITLIISCSMCGKQHPEDFEIEIAQQLNAEQVKYRVEKTGWILQVNGSNIDTYCSKGCAE